MWPLDEKTRSEIGSEFIDKMFAKIHEHLPEEIHERDLLHEAAIITGRLAAYFIGEMSRLAPDKEKCKEFVDGSMRMLAVDIHENVERLGLRDEAVIDQKTKGEADEADNFPRWSGSRRDDRN